ncbi:MAG TPA: hypothetical protein VMN57_13680 [Anaerolineales bacterium]|nr:hypothetical protein [Anaerolineales bacterium]
MMLKKFWEGWKRFGQLIGDVIARVVLTVFYFTVFLPFGLMSRLFADPLGIRTRGGELWQSRETRDRKMADLRKLS